MIFEYKLVFLSESETIEIKYKWEIVRINIIFLWEISTLKSLNFVNKARECYNFNIPYLFVKKIDLHKIKNIYINIFYLKPKISLFQNISYGTEKEE